MKKMNWVIYLFSLGLLASIQKPPPVEFMTEAEQKTNHTVQQIFQHPFIIELINGTLSAEKFDYYEGQDDIYDYLYANVLLGLAAKAPEPELKNFLVTAATDSTNGWRTTVPDLRKQCPSCRAYSNSEELAVQESFSGGLAAMTPCYTLYYKLMLVLMEKCSPRNSQCQKIIQDNWGPKFKEHLAKLEAALNAVARQEGIEGRNRMLDKYMDSMDFEWGIFNSAYYLTPQQPAHQDK